ncbi:hypothetical protein PR048_008468 [Dryococelus australis]|uniref:C3H1-type domain-containing protein n=1 Tax=Dryococelus australis TaxID=614101 RepID=A0ABQ9HX84_9NEOP|nr:hypothetical protein PR048_008468 [Dryococelus australis]
MCEPAMDDRKKSFQVKLDLLMLECNIACKNINTVLQRSSSLVAYLLYETDHMKFSKYWPDVMAGLDAFIHPVAEFNFSLDKQLYELPSVETKFPANPRISNRNVDVSVSRKEASTSVPRSSHSANAQLQDVQHACPNNNVSPQLSGVQQLQCPSSATNMSLPLLKQPVIGVGSVTESNCSLDKQQSVLPSVETMFPANPQISNRNIDVSVSRKDASTSVPGLSNSANDQLSSMQQLAWPSSATNMPLPVIKQSVIRIGSMLRMTYLHGDTPESFWLRFASDDELNKAKQSMLEMISASTVKALETCPSIGDYVCTVVDNSTVVRGEVRNMKNNGVEGVRLVLFDVDSGNTLIVNSKNLWKLESELAAVPAQAVHCRLKGKLGSVPPHAFVDVCANRHLEVKFCNLLKGSYPYYAVKLFSSHTATDSKMNVNKWVTKFFSAHCPTGSNKVSVEIKENNESFIVTESSPGSQETESSTSLTSSKSISPILPVSSVEVSTSNNANTCSSDTCNSISNTISMVEESETKSFPKNDIFIGELAYGISPSEFYMHIGSNKHEAHLLSEVMKFHYLNKSEIQKTKEEAMQKVGVYGACLFNEVFYRVKILDWMPEDQKNICVQFMDYGYISHVPFTSIQSLHHKFDVLPELANKCHLSNILPADLHGKVSGDWSPDAIKFFSELLQPGVQYTMYVARNRINDPPDSLAVILVDEHDGNSNILNDTLLSCEYAISVSSELCPDSPEIDNGFVTLAPTSDDSGADFEHFDPMTEDHNSNLNTYDHDVEDARFVVSGWKSSDEEQVCPLFRRHGHCRRPPGTCMKKHISLDPNGVVPDKEMVYDQAFSELKFPESTNFRVVLTAADSLSVLYCVLVEEVTENSEDVEAEEVETLASLTRYMNQLNNVRKMKRLLLDPALGQIVIAKHWNGLWHRARVVDWSCSDADEAVVMFVDSGEKFTVLEKDLCIIEPKYLHLPFQAVEFRLNDLKLDSLDELERKLYLEKLQGMIGIEFTATVVSWSPALELILNSDDGELVSLLEDHILSEFSYLSIQEE